MLRFVILTAVSTEEQAQPDAPSLSAQRIILETLAAQLANGQPYTVVDVLEIAGFSRYYTNWDLFCAAAAAAGHDAPRRMERHWQQRDFDVLLALDISRVGRREGIVVDFVSRTIDAGAVIHLKHGGELNPGNYGAMMMINAYSTAQESRLRRERTVIGHQGRFERGLHHAKPPLSHRVIRDELGKPNGGYVLDERFLPVWREVADLLLAGVAWDRLEASLVARGIVNPVTNKPFPRLTLRRLIQSTPMFWGHMGRHMTRLVANGTHSHPVMPWLWDESVPVPDNVKLIRNVVPAVWTGVLAEQIRHELTRRLTLRGRAYAEHTYEISGLCVCAECGYSMAIVPNRIGGKTYLYLRCFQKRHGRCSSTVSLRYADVKVWITGFLESLLAQYQQTGAVHISEANTTETRRGDTLQLELAQIDAQIEKLIGELSLLPDVVSGQVRQKIESLGQRKVVVRRDLAQMTARLEHQRTSDLQSKQALDDILSLGLDQLWQQPSRKTHQLLHKLFGEYRIHLKGKQILGLKHHF